MLLSPLPWLSFLGPDRLAGRTGRSPGCTTHKVEDSGQGSVAPRGQRRREWFGRSASAACLAWGGFCPLGHAVILGEKEPHVPVGGPGLGAWGGGCSARVSHGGRTEDGEGHGGGLGGRSAVRACREGGYGAARSDALGWGNARGLGGIRGRYAASVGPPCAPCEKPCLRRWRRPWWAGEAPGCADYARTPCTCWDLAQALGRGRWMAPLVPHWHEIASARRASQ
jgi:hypothetical protein